MFGREIERVQSAWKNNYKNSMYMDEKLKEFSVYGRVVERVKCVWKIN